MYFKSAATNYLGTLQIRDASIATLNRPLDPTWRPTKCFCPELIPGYDMTGYLKLGVHQEHC